MRTTLDLDPVVMKAVKRAAADSGRTMTQVIEESLRDALLRRDAPSGEVSFVLRLPTVAGGPRAGVDLTDRGSLFEAMEGRR